MQVVGRERICGKWATVAVTAFGLCLTLIHGLSAQDENVASNSLAAADMRIADSLSDEQATALARLALSGIDREYPNKPANVMTGPESVVSPSTLHPAFFGCYDWHSSVHGHWMLVRLLRLHPDLPIAGDIIAAIDRNFTTDKIEIEAAYFLQTENRSFERMYGWAWALRLAAELHLSDAEYARRWRDAISPLETTLVQRVLDYLPKLDYPIRTGVHPDTAFALGQILDYARTVGHVELEKLVVQRSKDYFQFDQRYPFHYEPSGEDFFSSGLNESDLMRRVLDAEEFSKWLDRFLPETLPAQLAFVQPVVVSDVTDPKIVHLAGLNLSRSWCLDGIQSALPTDDPRREALKTLTQSHAAAGLGYVFSGHYEGEHWLATFAVYSLTRAGIAGQ